MRGVCAFVSWSASWLGAHQRLDVRIVARQPRNSHGLLLFAGTVALCLGCGPSAELEAAQAVVQARSADVVAVQASPSVSQAIASLASAESRLRTVEEALAAQLVDRENRQFNTTLAQAEELVLEAQSAREGARIAAEDMCTFEMFGAPIRFETQMSPLGRSVVRTTMRDVVVRYGNHPLATSAAACIHIIDLMEADDQLIELMQRPGFDSIREARRQIGAAEIRVELARSSLITAEESRRLALASAQDALTAAIEVCRALERAEDRSGYCHATTEESDNPPDENVSNSGAVAHPQQPSDIAQEASPRVPRQVSPPSGEMADNTPVDAPVVEMPSPPAIGGRPAADTVQVYGGADSLPDSYTWQPRGGPLVRIALRAPMETPDGRLRMFGHWEGLPRRGTVLATYECQPSCEAFLSPLDDGRMVVRFQTGPTSSSLEGLWLLLMMWNEATLRVETVEQWRGTRQQYDSGDVPTWARVHSP